MPGATAERYSRSPPAGGKRNPFPVTTIALTPEHYNRIVRLLEKKVPVTVQAEVQAEISDQDVSPANIVAEIPGGPKADELIIVGAHLDSWIGGTGATDNGSGSAVALEAMRILKTLKLRLDRTVRIVLWSGEEQGLPGSKAYVKEHFGDPKTVALKSEHEKVSAYFNLDNGSGKIRGVYLQENDAARPYFEKWLAPFRDPGVNNDFAPQYRRDRSPVVRCRRIAGLPVYSGPTRIHEPHASLEHGHVRPCAGSGPDAGRRSDGVRDLPCSKSSG